MYLKRKNLILSIIMMVVLVSSLIGSTGQDSLDSIYNRMKQGGPVYQWEARDITIQNKGMNIIGTLTVPKVSKSCPIILILHGFLGERHGMPIAGTSEGYFDRLARKLAEQGFSSLRIDFRGSGQSEGTFDITSFSGQVSDAIAALDYIETLDHPVKFNKIGVLGHSQGGIITSLTADADKRVETVVLWAAPAYPPHDYEGFMLREGIKAGTSLPDGGIATISLYIEGVYLLDVMLGKQFFVDLFTADPLVSMNHFKKPMMYVSTLKDVVVWPQPQVGNAFIAHHNGYEKLLTVNSDHNFDFFIGPEAIDYVIDWTIAWYIQTLGR